MAVIECVPNFSEGCDSEVIAQIVAAISSVPQTRVLHVDMGASANRTVVTFAGEPEAVVESAFRGIQMAAEKIDMCRQQGAHPRIGAADVCPLVPVSGISMEETAAYARDLGRKVGEELGIPVFLYEQTASRPERKNLAYIRKGGYEKLQQKLIQPEWRPDYGPDKFNAKTGATVIGARDFLIAYNINLNTEDVNSAKMIAREVRIPDELRAIGWYMAQYKKAQVSLNLINLQQMPLHKAFEKVEKCAEKIGLKITGSELIGLIPLHCLTEAGAWFMKKDNLQKEEENLIAAAIRVLGLDTLKPFYPQERILEYALLKSGIRL